MDAGFSKFSGIKFNVIISFIGKGISVLCSFLLIPLILGYLDSTRYGIWLTITSLLQWITLFDFGFVNGFRNRFVEAKARGDEKLASQLVSTTYFAMALVSIFVILVFTIGYLSLDMSRFLNAPQAMAREVNVVIYVVCVLQGAKFATDVINILITANHKIGIVNLTSASSSALSLLICYLIPFYAMPSLLVVATILIITPILLNLVLSFYYFNNEYAHYKPQINAIDFRLVSSIVSVGGQFFALQIIGLVIYTTANIIISNLYSPEEVTPYNIAIKYFSITTVAFNIIIAPFWSRFTHEYEINNYPWIRNAIKKLMLICLAFSVLSIIMLVLSEHAYRLWLSNKVYIPFSMSLAAMLFSILTNWCNIFAYFLNGVSRIRLQLIGATIQGILFLPLSILLARNFQWGPIGVIYATNLVMLIGATLAPIQYHKIINEKAVGIWSK